jgi:transglutaminase-like putative cysteine protease
MKKIIFPALSLLFITIFQFQLLAKPNEYPNGLTSPEKIYTISKTLNAKDYKNSDSIIVNDLNQDTYAADGTGNSWSDCSVKIFTEKGRDNNKVQSFSFSANYSTLNLILVEVIKPDGSVTKIDTSKQSKTAIDTSQMSSNIYDPNSKVLTVNIPDLKIGDTVRCVTYEKLFKAPIQNTWSNILLFEGTFPIHHLEYTIKAPHSLPLVKIALLSEIKGTVKYNKIEGLSGTTYNWTVNNVPRMFPEPQMPAASSVVQRLLVSTMPNWEFISKWYWNLCKPHMDATPEMKSKTQELIKNAKTDKEKIKRIFDFVSQKIRYMGLIAEQKSPGMEPHDVKLTFENRYGVCRDKAVLLTEMLRLAGYDAYPVIIKVGPKLDKEVPMQYFNHAITCVELNGINILMDPTNENTKDIFPAYLSNLSYVVAKPNGATLQTSPIIPADKNLMDINTEGEISKDGKLKATSTIQCFGINDTIYRSFLSRMTPAQLEQLFDKMFRFIIPSAKVTKLNIFPKDLQDTNQQIKLVISYTADSEIIEGKTNAMLSVPWIGKSLGFVSQVIQATGLEERKYPLVTEFTCGYSENIDLKLNDPSLKLTFTPKYNSINTDIISYNQNISLNDNNIKGKSELAVNVVEFTTKQYLELKQVLKFLEVDRKKKIIFNVNQESRKTVKSDTTILNNNINVKIETPHSWTAKYSIERQILTYNGKKDFSEIKIPYNPVWSSIENLKAEVISKSGKVSKLKKDEINTMDMPWVSSAPRYPSGKILVANLPSVEVGSIIKYSFEKKVINKPFFSSETTFQEFAPIKKYTYSLEFPEELTPSIYKYKTDSIIETKSENNGIIKYVWSTKDIPAIKKVSSLPPDCTFLPTIMTSFESWKSYSSNVLAAAIPKTVNQKNVDALTRKLIKDKNTDNEKIIAIRDYAAKYIRSDGPDFTSLPLSSISSADQVLKDGYGNKMDQAVLIYSMLKYAGFSPDFVLASGSPYLKEILQPIKQNPQRQLFSSVLIKVTSKDGSAIYLNDTDEYSVLGSTIHENCIGLDLSNSELIKIQPTKGKYDKIQVFYDLTISNNGKAKLDVTKKYYGNIYSATKEMFDKMIPENRKRYYQRRMAIISQLAAPSSELYTNFKDYPGIEKYSANIKDYATTENDYFYFTLPLMLQFVLNLDGNTRNMPFFMTNTQNIEFFINIKLPEKYKDILIHPQSTIIGLPGNSGEITINSTKISNDTYNDIIKIQIKPAIYSPEAYQELLGIDKKLSSPKIKTFLLKE